MFLLLDIIGFISAPMIAVLLAKWFEVEDGHYLLLSVLGSFLFFFGKYFSGSGYLARYHFVNVGTPELIWKIAGIACWIGAILISS